MWLSQEQLRRIFSSHNISVAFNAPAPLSGPQEGLGPLAQKGHVVYPVQFQVDYHDLYIGEINL